MKKIAGLRKVWLSCVGIGLLTLFVAPRNILAGQLDPSNWIIYNFSGSLITNLTGGPPLPPTGLHIVTSGTNNGGPPSGQTGPAPSANQLTNLADGNLGSFATLAYPAVLLTDLGATNVVDRVYVVGSMKPSNMWVNASASGNIPPLGLIVVYVGNTPATANQVATYTVPYDAGNPVETEADIRFSPAVGRFVRLELHTQIAWGNNTWPGFTLGSEPASINVGWNVGELELYGFTGPAAAQTNVNAVVLPTGAAGPLALAAGDLSYYLGELSGLPYPIIPPQSTNQFSGTLYQIVDLASLAPNYSTMMANISSGVLPTNINATVSGRVVTFKSWPYRSVLWSVWQFLESQGVRWVYPDSHGDYVPTNGINLLCVPFQYTPPTFSIYANFELNPLEPWPAFETQSLRQEYLYPWRNHWTVSCDAGYGPAGGNEIPVMPSPNIPVNGNYTEGFTGYPHNLGTVVPNRLLDSGVALYTNWWGWAATNAGSKVDPSTPGAPVITMDDPTLISWVANKMTNIAAAEPLACSSPLNLLHWRVPFNILPVDDSAYSQDPFTIASNGPPIGDPVPWVKKYGISYSGMYYSLVTSVAKKVQQLSPSNVPLVGALAYADVFLPPTNIAALTPFPTNVHVDVCLYGSPNLAMSAPANSGLLAALNAWHADCSHLGTYDYSLLHTDYEQTNPVKPVALIAGTMARSQFLATIGALDVGCQGNLSSLPYNPWNFYAYTRTRWNTNQTAAQIEQEFFTGYFREAAAPMLAYYQAMENYQFTNNIDLHYLGYCYAMTPGSFPVNILAQMQTNLLAAEALATNKMVVDRVANIAVGFGWLITNSPDALAGTDWADLSQYQALNPTTTPTTINLTTLVPTANMIFGNNASHQGTNGWWMSAPAQLQHTYNIPAGTYRIDVLANGAVAAGGWPTMNIAFGPDSSSALVNSASNATYSFTFTIPAGIFDLVFSIGNNTPGYLVIDGVQITKQ